MNTDHHVILRVIAKMLIPVITMFAFYVQLSCLTFMLNLHV